MNRKSVRKAGMLLFILLFPAVLYLALSTGRHSFFNRPFYGPKTVIAENDTNYYQLSGIDFFDCRGDVFSFEELRGNIIVLSFFSQKNTALDSRINGQMLALQDRYRDRTDLKFISVIMDHNDTVPLCQLEADFKVNKEVWKVGVLKNVSLEHFEKDVLYIDDHNSNFAKSIAVLIDKAGHIRGYRDASQYIEMKEIVDDIKILKAEEFIPRKKKR